jgi:hypothetical protein
MVTGFAPVNKIDLKIKVLKYKEDDRTLLGRKE